MLTGFACSKQSCNFSLIVRYNGNKVFWSFQSNVTVFWPKRPEENNLTLHRYNLCPTITYCRNVALNNELINKILNKTSQLWLWLTNTNTDVKSSFMMQHTVRPWKMSPNCYGGGVEDPDTGKSSIWITAGDPKQKQTRQNKNITKQCSRTHEHGRMAMNEYNSFYCFQPWKINKLLKRSEMLILNQVNWCTNAHWWYLISWLLARIKSTFKSLAQI